MTTATDIHRIAAPRPAWAPWLEVGASVAACGSIVALAFNWLSVNLTFFGVEAVADRADVTIYWTLVVLIAAGVIGSFVGAYVRAAGAALIWHVLVAIGASGAAVLFAVPTVGPVVHHAPPPSPTHSGPACYSSGDARGCPGG